MRNFLNDIRKTDKNISVYKQTRNTGLILLAGINVFLFFTGMLTSYYAYTRFIAGFFPKSYIMIWLASVVIFYKNPKQLVHMTGLSIVMAVIWNIICPFRY